jgi:hypothetical protein
LQKVFYFRRRLPVSVASTYLLTATTENDCASLWHRQKAWTGQWRPTIILWVCRCWNCWFSGWMLR